MKELSADNDYDRNGRSGEVRRTVFLPQLMGGEVALRCLF